MSIQDYFKKSVWNAFTASSGITLEFDVNALIAIGIAILFGVIIYKVYKAFYGGVVYSQSFAVTLIGMTVMTCMLTLAISSNVVISLGMVGALSIVRYRTAVKDPMDLFFMFWAISVGITTAANLYFLAAMAMLVMTLIVIFFYNKHKTGSIYIMVVHYENDDNEENILRAISKTTYQIRSKVVRKGGSELTVELKPKHGNTSFVDTISQFEGVKDVSLIQYNGEYNG